MTNFQFSNCGRWVKEIVGKVDHITTMMQQIAAATTEQSAAADQISGDIEYIAGITKESLAYSMQITYAGDTIANLSRHLQSKVDRFKIADNG